MSRHTRDGNPPRELVSRGSREIDIKDLPNRSFFETIDGDRSLWYLRRELPNGNFEAIHCNMWNAGNVLYEFEPTRAVIYTDVLWGPSVRQAKFACDNWHRGVLWHAVRIWKWRVGRVRQTMRAYWWRVKARRLTRL